MLFNAQREGDRERERAIDSCLNLQEEGIELERIIVHLHTAHITQDFEHDAAKHASQKAPSAVAEAEAELGQEDDGEEAEIGDIGGQRGHVFDLCVVERASLQGAVFRLNLGARHGCCFL
jgi:hypothetical protein